MSSAPITELLQELRDGEGESVDRFVEAVHSRLQSIAQREIAQRYGGRAAALTIEPGVLADDALMKLIERPQDFENRRHFFAYATQIMVRALIDYQRERMAQKRGGDLVRVTLTRAKDERGATAVEVERLPPLLNRLQDLDPRSAEIVQLRVFWGMTVTEIAELLETSESTVKRNWRFAKRWLATQLQQPAEAV